MEQFTEKEAQQLRELQAKQKRIQRQEKAFFEDADARKDELLARWGISNDTRSDLDQIADLYYGVSGCELRDWITSDRQVEYFKRMHPSGV